MATISQPSPTPRLTLRRLFGNLPLPPGQVTGVAVMFFLGRTSPRSLPGPDLLHRMVGSGLLVIGGGLNAWALAERDRRSTGSFDLERPEELLTSGPYAMTRHPMYVGWWLIHLGAGTLTGSSWVVVTLPVGMLMDHLGVLREEAALLEAFGRPYAEYEKRVHRYLGTRSRRR